MTAAQVHPTWDAVVQEVLHHRCTSESDVCACRFAWACPACGRAVREIGEGIADRDYRHNPLCDQCYAKQEGIDL